MSRKRKAELVEALAAIMDEALKYEALSLLKGAELLSLVDSLGLKRSGVGTRKPQLIQLLLSHDDDDQELVLSVHDFMLPDRQRLDLPHVNVEDKVVEMVPSRPTGAELTLFFEVQALCGDKR